MHEKDLEDLKNFLFEKLAILLKDKISAGITNNFGETVLSKGGKFNSKTLGSIDFQNVNPLSWTGDKETDDLINQLLHNYNISSTKNLAATA